jgi:predicted naringenin-chalcone synthase
MVARPVIAGMGVAHPPGVRQEELWAGFFAAHFGGRERMLAKRIFANSGVVTRHGVINPLIEDVSHWSTSRRMERYLAEALPLGKEATSAALAASGVSNGDIGLFAVCSCTGYVTPGLDILLARDLGLAPAAQRLFIGHMGCYAAMPGLGTVSDFVAARSQPALLLCAELPSLHVQPPTADPQQIVAHALFSDGAAAVVVVPGETSGVPATGGYTVTEVASVTDTATADQMTWDVTDLGFRMGLSAQVPDVLAMHVGPLVADLLARHSLAKSDIDGWAVHPGGPRILDVVERELGLTEEQMSASRDGLAAHGNCSSATILLIIDAMLRSPVPPKRLLALAFGPGLTLYATLLSAAQ